MVEAIHPSSMPSRAVPLMETEIKAHLLRSFSRLRWSRDRLAVSPTTLLGLR